VVHAADEAAAEQAARAVLAAYTLQDTPPQGRRPPLLGRMAG
jgi:hypothetical protein